MKKVHPRSYGSLGEYYEVYIYPIFGPEGLNLRKRAILLGFGLSFFGPWRLFTKKETLGVFFKPLLDTPTTLRGGVNECGVLFPKTSLLHKNSSISIQHLFITHCCHL
jgi:hypothetical protein